MSEHTRLARFATRVKEARERGRERREVRATKQFETTRQRLEREGEIEERRARIRKSQAVARPRGTPTGEGFGQRFVRAQQSFFPVPSQRTPIRRKVPRRAAPGRVLFDQFGRAVSVRNAPTVRRARRRRKQAVQQQPQQSPFAPTFRF